MEFTQEVAGIKKLEKVECILFRKMCRAIDIVHSYCHDIDDNKLHFLCETSSEDIE
ncbi:hypothetical protein MUS1_04980 [Marinomonas ushuaiensis DSM 15871]|uniref:Uncharacterized protein n=1 Tax=Marinomonas ushuaiensis DSM 15871 TaxID=1122207 RepID=X7E1S3_9GAMM|nr:hypothetical protein MUS1_04980 [Marinomonas ushuaiensis DSM 15871]